MAGVNGGYGEQAPPGYQWVNGVLVPVAKQSGGFDPRFLPAPPTVAKTQSGSFDVSRLFPATVPAKTFDGGGADAQRLAAANPALLPGGGGAGGSTTGSGGAGAQPSAGATGAAGAGGQSTSPANVASVYEGDPFLAQVRLGNESALDQAAASKVDAVKRLLLQYGDPALARSILQAEGNDPREAKVLGDIDAFLGGISGDANTSLSTLAQLNRKYAEAQRSQDNALSQSNLFYSGTGAQAASDFDYARKKDYAGARGQVEDALRKIAGAYMDAQNQARNNEFQGQQDAYNRAIQEALQYGYGGGGSSIGGSGGGGGGGLSSGGQGQGAGSSAPQAKKAKGPSNRGARLVSHRLAHPRRPAVRAHGGGARARVG